MDLITSLNIGTAAEIALTAILCGIFTQAIKKTALSNKWLPWVSIIIGAVIGVCVSLYYHDTWATGAILGVLIGGFTSGLYDGITAPLNKVSAGTPTVDDSTTIDDTDYKAKNLK